MLVGLDLFNNDTCPSGHISRPTKVNVSQELFSFSKKPSYTGTCVSELLSFSKQLLKSDHIVHTWELVEVNILHHIKWKTPASRRNSTMQVSGIVSKRAFNEPTVLYSSRHSCNNAHSSNIWSMVSVWPQWWQPVGSPRDKIWDLVALVWPIRSRVITTSSTLVCGDV